MKDQMNPSLSTVSASVRANVARNMQLAASKDIATHSRIAGEISDVSKEVYGFRDRFDWEAMSVSELRAYRAEWYRRADAERACDAQQEEDCKHEQCEHRDAVRAALTPSPSFTIGNIVEVWA